MGKPKATVRIELDSAGIAQLLGSSGVTAECVKQANRIAKAAGEGFGVSASWKAGFGGGRAAVSVSTDTQAAREAEANEKRLSKAVSACRS